METGVRERSTGGASKSKSFCRGIYKPFKKEFDLMLDLYGDDDREDQKHLAESMKCVMSTFSMIGSLWLSAVWGVSGPDIAMLEEDSIWGSFNETGHAIYKALTTCVSILCILLVGTTARTTLLLNLIPYGGHKNAIRRWGHMYIVVLPYLLFALIIIMVGLSITLQATLTSSAAVGLSIGISLVLLSLAFIKVWVWADQGLGATLATMVSKSNAQNGVQPCAPPLDRLLAIVEARRLPAPVRGSSRGRGGTSGPSSS